MSKLPDAVLEQFRKYGSQGGKRSWRAGNRAWRLKQLAEARKVRSRKCSATAGNGAEK